ncbi:MAG: non-ribosomal peptide synthetase, partial [bacterium]|nr:non-ribosomal peptide synthetase [bacterium]
LPAPESSRPQLETARVAPRTGIERAIAAVWREVLGLDEVGVDDNFFELGGQSFAIIKVSAGLRERLHRDLPVSELFMHPTIRSLAQHLSEGEVPHALSESAAGPAEDRIARRDSLRRLRRRRQRHRSADQRE